MFTLTKAPLTYWGGDKGPPSTTMGTVFCPTGGGTGTPAGVPPPPHPTRNPRVPTTINAKRLRTVFSLLNRIGVDSLRYHLRNVGFAKIRAHVSAVEKYQSRLSDIDWTVARAAFSLGLRSLGELLKVSTQ